MTWQDDLSDNGIMMEESAVISALSTGANTKAELAGTTVSIQESNFCTSLDSAICELASSFIDSNETVFSSDLSELCSAAGYSTVVYGAPANAIILKNGGVRFSAEYVAQRKDILDLFVNLAPTGEELIPTQSLSIVHKPLFMINEGTLEIDITPSNANAGVTWTMTNGGSNTINDGNITVEEYASATISVTANDDNSLTDSATITMCKVDKENNNAVANAVAVSGLTYTQNGVTMTHNADGTITLNGTTTSGDTAYIRFVIWPIGSQKTARNIDLLEISPLAESASPFAVWYEYVSGDVDFTRSTLSVSGHGTKAFEIYYMISSSQFDSKIEHYVNGSGDRQDCDIHSIDPSYSYLSAIVFGYQMKKGTTFDHFTFKVGLSMANPSSSELYPSSMLDECLLEPYHFNIIDYNSCMLARYYSGLFVLWVSNVSYNREISFCKQSTTPFQIGEVGHTYRFVAHIVTIKFTSCVETTDAFMRFELRDSSGNIMGSTDIYTPGAVCSNAYWTNLTRTIELTLTAPIADVVLHWYDTRIAQNHNQFYFTFEEITE